MRGYWYDITLIYASARSRYFGLVSQKGITRRFFRGLATWLFGAREAVSAGQTSVALKRDCEVTTALRQLSRLGLVPHVDREKNWDAFLAFSFIVENGPRTSAVLDMGSALYGRILPWLHLYGFEDLHGCDLSFAASFRRGLIQYSPQNIEETSYPEGRFDYATCLSVIEHGVDEERFFREASRLLRKGGYLLLSTDYWNDPIDCGDLYDDWYRCPVKVFSSSTISRLLQTAGKFGFVPVENPDLSCEERVVSWERHSLRFTFLFLALRLAS